MGKHFKEYKTFPILIKLIDAKDRLSLQVHPDDLYAQLIEEVSFGKCEMWYVVKAKKGAKIAMGLKIGITKTLFMEAMLKGDLESCINEVPVEAGDVINIPAGLLHAIGEDIMIAEIQQNSDTVYRVHDWGRLGLDGKPRELHKAKAISVIDFEQKIPKGKVKGLSIEEKGNKRWFYIINQYFAIEKIEISDCINENTDYKTMMTFTCLKGKGYIVWKEMRFEFQQGESILVPAEIGEFIIKGDCQLLKSYIPRDKRKAIEPLLENGYDLKTIYSQVAIDM